MIDTFYSISIEMNMGFRKCEDITVSMGLITMLGKSIFASPLRSIFELKAFLRISFLRPCYKLPTN